jgi:hypothetical protein
MKNWQIIGAITLLVLAIAAWRILSYEHERNSPAVVLNKQPQEKPTDDDLVYVRQMLIDSMKSARALNGKSVWMKAGYTVPYYPYRTGRVGFRDQTGWLPPTQELLVKDFVEVTTPPDWNSSIPRGPKNVFVIFTEPGRSGEFAAPVASLDGANSTWVCDDIFFYQDPRSLYHWPPEVWKAVAEHTARQGMSEKQTTMALGNLQQSDSKDPGNRTVKYTTLDQGQTRHFAVSFSGNKATSVSSQ